MSSNVEQIKSRLNVVDVVQSYIKLQKAGANYKAPCPFHSEKSPSFFVSPERESWHCFGCNRGGDIFSFVQEIEGMEFPEALRMLADRAGVELKAENPEHRSEKNQLLKLIETAKKFYQINLKKNQKVIDYLKDRGLTGESARDFEIGYISGPPQDGWDTLCNYLKLKGFSEMEIEKAGLAMKSKSYYDRFRNRIMFPLNTSVGQTVGFSGRIFETTESSEQKTSGTQQAEPAKYINTPQTSLYDKSRILYGFDRAKTEIRKKDNCILVEGQMDVIMSHQAGFINTVAVSGTALTEEHLKMIKRLTNNLIFAFDKDEAGFRASKRSIDMALVEGFEIKAAVIPSGKDPADTIQQNPKEWANAITGARNFIEFYLDTIKEKFSDPRELNKEVVKNILPYISLIADDVDKNYWVKKISQITGFNEDPIREQLKKMDASGLKRNTQQNRPQDKAVHENVVSDMRINLLRKRLRGFLIWQKDSKDEELKKEVQEIAKKFDFDLSTESGLESESNVNHLVFEAELFYNNSTDLKKEFKTLAFEYEKESLKERLELLTADIRRSENKKDSAETKKLLEEFYNITKELNSLSINT